MINSRAMCVMITCVSDWNYGTLMVVSMKMVAEYLDGFLVLCCFHSQVLRNFFRF